MSSINQPAFTTVFDSAYRFASENIFFKNFTEQSKVGNYHNIIQIIREIPELVNLIIKESYVPKSNEKAKKFLKEAEQTDKNKTKIFYLTKALFAAEIKSDDSIIFFDTLMRIIRYSFTSQHFEKCIKNCRYMISLLNKKMYPSLKESDNLVYKIECLSYETRCLKIFGDSEEAKILARNGIKETKDFFKLMEEGGMAITSEKKLEVLRPFLGVLNEGQRDVEKSNAIIRTRSISIPEVSGKHNYKLKSCSDAVELRYDEARGRHLVATRNIKIGSVLIVDKPFSWSTNEEMIDNNCLHCHKSLKSTDAIQIPCHNCQTVKFCSEDCRIESWEKYHRWECVVFDYFYRLQRNQSSRLLLAYRTTILLAMQHISTEDDQLSSELIKYFSKNSSDSQKLEIGLNDSYDPYDYRTVYSLRTNANDIDPKVNLMHAVHSVLLAKCFCFVYKQLNPKANIGDAEENILAVATLHHLQAINSNAYEIVENVLDKRTTIWEPRTVGGAIYPTVSLSNHSCFPNVVRHTYPKGEVAVRAIRFIRKGAEILDCYGPHYLRDTKAERQDYLLKKYNFNCACEACNKNLGSPLSSALYKCTNCSVTSEKYTNSCIKCGTKIDRTKIDKTIKESVQQRSIAIQKMLDGDHAAALPILLRHAEIVDKIYADCSFEAVKTQQAVIQCFNSMSCFSK